MQTRKTKILCLPELRHAIGARISAFVMVILAPEVYGQILPYMLSVAKTNITGNDSDRKHLAPSTTPSQ